MEKKCKNCIFKEGDNYCAWLNEYVNDEEVHEECYDDFYSLNDTTAI